MVSAPAIVNRFKKIKAYETYCSKQNTDLKRVAELTNLIMDIPVTVLGGGVLNVGNLIIEPIKEAMQSSLQGKREVQMVVSFLKDENGVIGALSLIDKHINGTNTITLV